MRLELIGQRLSFILLVLSSEEGKFIYIEYLDSGTEILNVIKSSKYLLSVYCEQAS